MSDNKNVQDGRDRSKVDSQDKNEVEYVHQQFPGLSHEQIKEAIAAAGPVRKDIMEWLNKKHGGKK